ncbi:MAG TPA: hypothetical protein VGK74_25355 [Symbiobacteriaceae bacterium]|jgi:hypothetical protein
MTQSAVFPFTNLELFEVYAQTAEPVEWQGRDGLRLENGLILLKNLLAGDVSLQVQIWCTEAAYPGLAFRAQDETAHELVYVQPHTSGQWDAIQYDAVMGGSANWQCYMGPAYQGVAEIPFGAWLTLHAEVRGQQMAVWVWPSSRPLPAGTPPQLVVSRLAHGFASGRVGLWTYKPAYFSDLRVGPPTTAFAAESPSVTPAPGLMTDWWLEGVGHVRVEENGTLNLSRFLSRASHTGPAILTREIVIPPSGEAQLRFGFSDELELLIDDQPIFAGSCRFTGFANRAARGYIELGSHEVHITLAPGVHKLTARLGVSEPFGWGLVMAMT